MRSREFAAVTFTLTCTEPLSIADPQRISLEAKLGASAQWGARDREGVAIPIASGPDGLSGSATAGNAVGPPIVRGTSVFGALRAELTRYAVQPAATVWAVTISARAERGGDASQPAAPATERAVTLADVLCGSDPEELTVDEGGAPTRTRALRPSAMRVVSTTLRGSSEPDEHTRTALNRRRGAGETGKLFRRQELASAQIDVTLTIDLPILRSALATLCPSGAPSPGDVLADLESILLHHWQPHIGGQVSSGYGSADLSNLKTGRAEPLPLAQLFAASSTVDLVKGLVSRPGATSPDLVASSAPVTERAFELGFTVTAADPLLVAPTVSKDGDGRQRKVTHSRINGSTWRGLLRSRAEFILRSVGMRACESTSDPCPDGSCATCQLFGWTPPTSTAGTGEAGRPGLVRIESSRISPGQVVLQHVAIDRFTGGAADKKLYTHTAAAPGTTTTLTITAAHPDHPVPTWASDLLTLAVRDLVEGYVGVGQASTRGYGTVELAPDAKPLTVATGWLDDLRRALGPDQDEKGQS